jgi:hypothetical protein
MGSRFPLAHGEVPSTHPGRADDNTYCRQFAPKSSSELRRDSFALAITVPTALSYPREDYILFN